MDNNSLSHTTWNCKYHIVFAPKYRRKIIYGELKQDIANILSMLCKRKGSLCKKQCGSGTDILISMVYAFGLLFSGQSIVFFA